MRLRNTLILLGVTLALVLFVVVFERGTRSTDELLEAERLAFPGFKEVRARADAVEIIRGDAKTVIVKRKAGTSEEHWRIVHPIDYRADGSRIVGLFGAFARAERFKVGGDERAIPVVPTTDLRQYGLDQDSAIRVRIAAGDEALIDTFIGGKAAGGERVYVMPHGREEAYVVAEEVRENATRRLDELRDKRLLDLRAGVVTQLTVFENESPVYELAREKDGPWRMVSPVADRADDVLAGEMADKMGSLWADVFHRDFEPDDPDMTEKLAELDLRPSKRSVRLTLDVAGEVRQHEVLFGKRLKKKKGSETSWNVYAMVAGTRTVVHLPDDVVGKIGVKVDSLRDHRVFSFEVEDVEHLAIDRPRGPVRLERAAEEGWKLALPDEHEADPRRVKELLEELAGLRVAKFLPRDTKLVDPVRVEVGLAAEEGKAGGEREPELVFFESAQRRGSRREGTAAGRRGEAGAAFEVPGAVLDRLCAVKYRFWDRGVLELQPDDIRRIAVTFGGRTETAVREIVAGEAGGQDGEERREWRLAGEGEVDVDVADNIKWDFSDLEAEELLGPVEDAALAPYGLDAPWLRVEIGLEGGEAEGERIYALRVGSPAKAGGDEAGIEKYYARFEDDPMVFLLRKAVVRNVRKGLSKAKEKVEEKAKEAPDVPTERGNEQGDGRPAAGGEAGGTE